MFDVGQPQFVRCSVTANKTEIHHSTPETKQQSKQLVCVTNRWVYQSTKSSRQFSGMHTDCIIHIIYLQKKRTNSGECYATYWTCSTNIWRKNDWMYMCVVAMAKFNEKVYQLPHKWSWFSPERLFLSPKLEETYRRKEIWLQRLNHRSIIRLFW